MVATPIGNLEDITLRALRILREADMILAEDTRVTRKLLSHYGIHTPLASYHEHSTDSATEHYVHCLLSGKNVALVSDAGTPAISDPGDRLIARAVTAGIPVIPIPGVSAALAAMSVSGIAGGRHAFVGFPPRGRSDRRAFFLALRNAADAIVLYEAPQRIAACLKEALATLGDRDVLIARELTKRFETIFRGSLSRAIADLTHEKPRGEYTVVIKPPEASPPTSPEEDLVKARLAEAVESGLPPREAARMVAEATGLSARDAYRRLAEMKGNA